jgi:3-deoxy-D-manno-octulosonic-acid transferase
MPFVLLNLVWRGWKAKSYRRRRLERLGLFAPPVQAQDVWVHAVSVGEVLAAEPIIRELFRRYPNLTITVTTMTPTSSELLQKLFGDEVFHVYAPYDVPCFVKRFLKRIQPKAVIIMETELWPNMIHYASRNDCPVVLANARLSERSAKGYQRLKPAVGWMLDDLSLVLSQYEPDAQRFLSLGLPKEKVSVTGSLKYDFELEISLLEKGRSLRDELAPQRMLWIAASTHEGEDELLLALHQRLLKKLPDLLLVLVPRHPERFQSSYELAKQYDFRTARFSEHAQRPDTMQVYVLDAMGELMRFYAASDVAVIGGSFVPVGGHNPIEPGALGLPALIGPHYFNFQVICEQLAQAGALTLCADLAELERELTTLLQQPERAKAQGQHALDVILEGRGAVQRVVDHIAPLLTT